VTIAWFDGFDQYGADESLVPDGAWAQFDDFVLSETQARTGERSAALTVIGAQGRRSLGGDFDQVVMGCGFRLSRLPIPPFNAIRGCTVVQQFRNGANRSHISIQIGTTGRILIMGGGLDRTSSTTGPDAPVLLAQSTLEVAAGAWNHMETKAIFDADGSVEVKINGKTFVSYEGNTLFGTGGAEVAQIAIGSFDSSIPIEYEILWWDDIFVSVGETADFLGQMGVYYLQPVSDAAPQEWDYTTGANGYPLISEIPPDGDVDYIFSESVGNKARFAVEPLPVNVLSVAAVAPLAYARKTDSGDCNIQLGVFSIATLEMAADDKAMATSYNYFFDVWETDPGNGDGAWTPSAMPNIQVERTV